MSGGTPLNEHIILITGGSFFEQEIYILHF